VNGYVARWSADIGAHVRKGQVLAEIDTPELDAQLDAARANLNTAQAQVGLREAESQFATTTYERWHEAPKGVVSEQERESKKADFDAAQARLNSALRAGRARPGTGRQHLRDDTLQARRYAPFDGHGGRTAHRHRQSRHRRQHHPPPSRSIASVRIGPCESTSTYRRAFAADLLRSAPEAEVRANALPNQVFRGRVARTAQANQPAGAHAEGGSRSAQ